MVFVNSKKFACESCIKGHRSSACHHTDRPLFEVKKKGRPVSQCEKCRELRQSRRLHSKCTCVKETDKEDQAKEAQALAQASGSSSSGSKTRRFVPIVPALPNGLKDILSEKQASSVVPDSRQRVDTLLNPCMCKSLWNCRCRSRVSNNSSSPRSISSSGPPSGNRSALSTRVAAITSLHPDSLSGSPSHKKQKRNSTVPLSLQGQGPELPPILVSTSSPNETQDRIPSFPTIPPMSAINMIAGSGCTCGFQCACPGCVEHRGPEHASKDRGSCADGKCTSCVDHRLATDLPRRSSTSASPSLIDGFFTRAAALPLPPANRKTSVQIDPTNMLVYPTAALGTEESGAAFGLVQVPKLVCCRGNCSCPVGRCDCGADCDDCSERHCAMQAIAAPAQPAEHITTAERSVVRSCCAGRNKA